VIGAGAGGLAAANQIYNAFKSRGERLNDGDIAIIDVGYLH
jgi:sulfide:quinone oxidoreductase